jgi:hypothetical protein
MVILEWQERVHTRKELLVIEMSLLTFIINSYFYIQLKRITKGILSITGAVRKSGCRTTKEILAQKTRKE